MRAIIFQVIGSWQIWVVTIALVIFISLVRYVSRGDSRRSHYAPAPKAKKEKAGAAAKGKEKPAAAAPKTDELGLEESGAGDGGGGGAGDGITYEE